MNPDSIFQPASENTSWCFPFLKRITPLLLFAALLAGCPGNKNGGTNGTSSPDPPPQVAFPEPGETETGPERAENRLRSQQSVEHLFEVCREDDFSLAADHIVYRGGDEARRWKTTCNYDSEEERLHVDKTCARIQGLIHGMKSANFKDYYTERESEGVWHVWATDLVYEDGRVDEVSFALLEIDGHFALGDID